MSFLIRYDAKTCLDVRRKHIQDLSQVRGNAGQTQDLSDMNTDPNYKVAPSCLQTFKSTKLICN